MCGIMKVAFFFLRKLHLPTNANDNAKEFWYMNDEAQIKNNIRVMLKKIDHNMMNNC